MARCEKSIAKEDVVGVGIGVPGPVDDKGVVYRCVNLGWGVLNINEELGRLLDMPVKGGNDANVAALGEMWKGGGQGFESIVVVTLGTGVGGGIIMNGKILTGAKGAAGEIGHIHVDDYIRLESRDYKGNYRVSKIAFSGDTDGGDWACKAQIVEVK